MLFILVLLRQPLQTVTNRKTHAIFCRNTIKIERVFLNYNPSELLTFCALDERVQGQKLINPHDIVIV